MGCLYTAFRWSVAGVVKICHHRLLSIGRGGWVQDSKTWSKNLIIFPTYYSRHSGSYYSAPKRLLGLQTAREILQKYLRYSRTLPPLLRSWTSWCTIIEDRERVILNALKPRIFLGVRHGRWIYILIRRL